MPNTFGTLDPFTVFVGSLWFWVFAITSVAAAALMVFSITNLVRAAIALTLTLAGVAAIYGLLAADFLAIVQLVVYIGAIMVLMIFAIFMTPGQTDDPGVVSGGQRTGAAVVAALFLFVSVTAIVSQPWSLRPELIDIPTAEPIGALMMSRYLLPFFVAAVLLTVALIGAIAVGRED